MENNFQCNERALKNFAHTGATLKLGFLSYNEFIYENLLFILPI